VYPDLSRLTLKLGLQNHSENSDRNYYYSEDSEVPGRSNNRVISRKFSMGKTSFTTRTQQDGTHEKATLSHIGNQRTESESPTWHRHGTGVSHDNTESLTLHRQGMA